MYPKHYALSLETWALISEPWTLSPEPYAPSPTSPSSPLPQDRRDAAKQMKALSAELACLLGEQLVSRQQRTYVCHRPGADLEFMNVRTSSASAGPYPLNPNNPES